MYKATREFIEYRSLFVKKFKPQYLPKVERIGGGEANECYKNSHNVKNKAKEKGERILMVCGWLVQPYKKETDSVAIIAHWWNADANGQYFDTSPLVRDDEQYVLDSDLYQYCLDNDEKLSTHLAYSLLHQHGKYELLINLKTMEFVPINELRTEYFYDLSLIP